MGCKRQFFQFLCTLFLTNKSSQWRLPRLSSRIGFVFCPAWTVLVVGHPFPCDPTWAIHLFHIFSQDTSSRRGLPKRRRKKTMEPRRRSMSQMMMCFHVGPMETGYPAIGVLVFVRSLVASTRSMCLPSRTGCRRKGYNHLIVSCATHAAWAAWAAWASILWAFSNLSSACSLSLFAPTCLGSLQPPCNQYSCPKSATWISNCWAWIAPELISAAATVEEAGFCYQKADVAEYLATGKKLTLFGTSKFAEEKWGDGMTKKRDGMTKKRKKSRKHERAGRQYKFAKADDYLEASRWPKQMTPKWNHDFFSEMSKIILHELFQAVLPYGGNLLYSPHSCLK